MLSVSLGNSLLLSLNLREFSAIWPALESYMYTVQTLSECIVCDYMCRSAIDDNIDRVHGIRR